MSVRLIKKAAVGHLTVGELATVLLGLGDPEMTVGVRRPYRDGEDESFAAVNVLLDEGDEGTWLVLE